MLKAYVLLKNQYPNGVVYTGKIDWKERQQRTGLSKSTFNRWADKLIKNDLAYIDEKSGVLRITGKHHATETLTKHKTQTDSFRYLKIDVTKDIILQIRKAIVKTKIDQVRRGYANSQARDSNTRKKYSRFLREAMMRVSNSAFAKSLKGSKSNAYYVLKKLESADELIIKRHKVVFLGTCSCKVKWEHRKNWLKVDKKNLKYCFLYKNKILMRIPNSYKITNPNSELAEKVAELLSGKARRVAIPCIANTIQKVENAY